MRDIVGMFCSGMCITHCLLTSFLLVGGSLGLLEAYLASEWVHKGLLIPVLLIALFSFPNAYRRHQHTLPGVFAIAGVCLMLAAVILHGQYETLLTVAGGSMLIVAHFYNYLIIKRQSVLT